MFQKLRQIDVMDFSPKIKTINTLNINPISKPNVLNIKSKLKNFALEDNLKSEEGISFPDDPDKINFNSELISELEKRVYQYLDEKCIYSSNPKEKIYAYYQKSKEKLMLNVHQKRNSEGIPEKSAEFLNMKQSPLMLRRNDKKKMTLLNH